MEPLIAQIVLFGGRFAPRGWGFCDGQLMPISDNKSLYGILGTAFGGDGRTTFALPDLRGRVPMHAGQGLGLTPRVVGQPVGSETTTLTIDEMPYHNHELTVSNASADNDRPTGDFLARATIYSASTTPTVALNPASIAHAGASEPHQNMQPTLCINYIIALQGVYPSRS